MKLEELERERKKLYQEIEELQIQNSKEGVRRFVDCVKSQRDIMEKQIQEMAQQQSQSRKEDLLVFDKAETVGSNNELESAK